MDAYHNSHDSQYRTPFGAVLAGETIRLSLDVTEAAARCFVVVRHDEADAQTLPMARGDAVTLRFSVVIEAPERSALLWYYFLVETKDGGAFYYGNNALRLGGPGECAHAAPDPYQITVYEPSRAPAWFRDGVVYQIFPDRFRRGSDWEMRLNMARRPEGWRGPARVIQENWDDTPFYTKNARGEVTRWPFFGGTLEGIREKLLYLKSLSVTVLYLNPIFEAASNHKYDTADYGRIDPAFGDEASFARLCSSAKDLGIRILLDGVFSHTGADSIYFNKYGNYSSQGACQGPDSPYYAWYHFKSFPDSYDSWWGVGDLPKADKNNDAYRHFICGTSGVVRNWLQRGGSGWRLDVADELPDDFIQSIRSAMDEENPDSLLLGEVWEDASHKISYGEHRLYLLGGSLQSVTNYPFRLAALDYMLGRSSASDFAARLMSQKENYPPEQFAQALNLIGSHDRPRALTLLGEAPDGITEQEKESFKLPFEKYGLAKSRLRQLSLLQFAAAGVPCVYYGDEAGAQGFEDPYNRSTYPWGKEDRELLEHYRLLGLFRSQFSSLREGVFQAEGLTEHVLAIRRRTPEEEILLLANRGIFEHETVHVRCASDLVLDLLTAKELVAPGGELSITMEPLQTVMLCAKSDTPTHSLSERAAGILCALSSLPSGRMDGVVTREEISRFVDFLAESGQKLWQLLPLNPIGDGDSPYYSPSLFALDGRMTDDGGDANPEEFADFCRQNAYWLEPDALYRALKKKNGGAPWQAWPEEERTLRDRRALLRTHAQDVASGMAEQFRLQRCWRAVREYAKVRGVTLVGDLPIYAAPDSVDVWAHQELFRLDEKGYAKLHAGVPPDYFSPSGQDWGNPLYDWEGARDGVYLFWENRLRRALTLYDTVRLDHFRSFSAYYAIPDDARPADGVWLSGAGISFFREMHRRLGGLPLVAEDLGAQDVAVHALLKLTGLPGMLVWQFSADEMQGLQAEEAAHRIFYSGTHDNRTTAGWCDANFPGCEPAIMTREILEKLYASHAPWVITPLQDVLGLADEARMNTPGTSTGNWIWKADALQLTTELSDRLRGWAEKYGRFTQQAH